MENVVSQSGHYAAILMRKRNQTTSVDPTADEGRIINPAEGETFAEFDFWRLETDFDKIIKAPADAVIIGTSRDDLEAQLDSRYASSEGFCMILFGNMEIPTSIRKGWRQNRYETAHLTGWRVLEYPLVTKVQVETIEQLQTISMTHNAVWIDRDLFRQYDFTNSHFVIKDRIGDNWRNDYVLIRFNPRHYQLRKWREEKARVEAYLTGEYPTELLIKLDGCLNPANWPSNHPFSAVIVSSGCHSIERLLNLIRFNIVVGPRSKFWRNSATHVNQYNCNSSFASILESLLIYHHSVLDKAREKLRNRELDIYKRRSARLAIKFTNWLLDEAKAMKIKIPDRPVVPPKPADPFARPKSPHPEGNPLKVDMDDEPIIQFTLPAAVAIQSAHQV
jgi:hypothetical protein